MEVQSCQSEQTNTNKNNHIYSSEYGHTSLSMRVHNRLAKILILRWWTSFVCVRCYRCRKLVCLKLHVCMIWWELRIKAEIGRYYAGRKHKTVWNAAIKLFSFSPLSNMLNVFEFMISNVGIECVSNYLKRNFFEDFQLACIWIWIEKCLLRLTFASQDHHL